MVNCRKRAVYIKLDNPGLGCPKKVSMPMFMNSYMINRFVQVCV